MQNLDKLMQKQYIMHEWRMSKNFQKRVDADLLDSVPAIYQSLGTSVGDAFVIFLKKSEDVKGLPFELRHSLSDQELDRQLTGALMRHSAERKLDFTKPEDAAFFNEDFSETSGN